MGVRYDDDEGSWLLDVHAETGQPEFAQPSLNALMALGTEVWRQTAVIVQVTSAGMTDHVTVTPQELRAALLRDGEASVEPAAPCPSPRPRDVLRLKQL